MRCATFEPDLVDLARGVIPADRRAEIVREEIEKHVRVCRRCAARLESERAISAALRRVAQDTENPPPDLRAERAVLEAFDAAWARPRPPVRSRTGRTMTAAAVLALAATLAWMIASRPARVPTPVLSTVAPAAARVEAQEAPRVRAAAPVVAGTDDGARPGRRMMERRPTRTRRPPSRGPLTASREEREFVTWPGAADLPTFESGHLMRMDLPVSVVLSLGLMPPASPAGVVQADLLVGQDGFARAVRLVP